MNPPTPEEARKALDRLVIYANNGWGSACPGEVDTLRRFIDAHSAPVQPEPVGWANAVEWLRNHYQDHPTIDGLCSAMRSASPPPAQPTDTPEVQAALRMVLAHYGNDPRVSPLGALLIPSPAANTQKTIIALKSSEQAMLSSGAYQVLTAAVAAQPPQAEPVAIAEVLNTGDYEACIKWLLNPLPVGTVLYDAAQPKREPLTDGVLDAVSNAMKRAWQLGQTYWQQADSDSYSAHKRSDATHRKFLALIDETRSAIERLTLGERG